MNMIAYIDNASQAIQNSFLDYYHSLVESFHDNSEKHLSYRAFANRTERATKALACEKEAIFYTVAYGKQHYASMEYLLSENLPLERVNQSAIRVVDYGCGQGIATLALLEYLANNELTSDMKIDIHLIEPSIISLKIAELLIHLVAKKLDLQVSVYSQHCRLQKAKIAFTDDMQTFHLMSNIVDIDSVQASLADLCDKIKSNQGEQFLFALSPDYSNTSMGFDILTNSLSFADELFNDSVGLLYYDVYRVVQGCYKSHNSSQRMLALHWQ